MNVLKRVASPYRRNSFIQSKGKELSFEDVELGLEAH